MAPAEDRARAAEIRRGWPLVAVAAGGGGVGLAGLFTYNSGLFVKPLEAEIGLSRTAYGLLFFACWRPAPRPRGKAWSAT